MSEIKTIMRWAKCKSKDWTHEKPGLLQQYGWLQVARKIRGKFGEFVRRRLKQSIKRAGGQAAPDKTFLRIPPGVSIVRSELRAWFCQMVRRAKGSLPLGEQQRWMDSLSIVQGRGTTVGDILVNGSTYCRQVKLGGEGRGRCSCHKYPELVKVMQERYPESWKKYGHIHMAAAVVPWDERDISEFNANFQGIDFD